MRYSVATQLVSATRRYENAAVNKAHGKRAALAGSKDSLRRAARHYLVKHHHPKVTREDVVEFLVDCGFERVEFEE